MGIDLLDVTFRLEKNVGVTVSRDDWYSLLEKRHDCTVGQIYDLLLRRRGTFDFLKLDIASNADLWERLRSTVASVQGVALSTVQLHTPFAELFPDKSRRGDWQDFGAASTLVLPRLAQPVWVNLVFCACYCVGLALLITWTWIPALVAACVLVWLVLSAVSGRLQTLPPTGVVTMKDFYKRVRHLNLGEFDAHGARSQDERQIWEGLKEALVDALGIDDDEITRDAWMVKDLGCE